MMEVTQLNQASDLPGQWERLAGSYFQRREFLAHCEAWNPCRQRYYLAWKNMALAAAVSFTLADCRPARRSSCWSRNKIAATSTPLAPMPLSRSAILTATGCRVCRCFTWAGCS